MTPFGGAAANPRETGEPLGIDGIQYLRGIAALMVVAHHARHYFPQAESWTSFGSRGVDIFFVISGFIMAHATQGFRSGDGRTAQVAEFLLKRVVRVVPLYWLALLWTDKRVLAVGQLTPDMAKDFFFIPHYHAVYADGIFPSLVPGWTINYEMFFYALFAGSMLLGRHRYAAIAATMTALVALGAVTWNSAPADFYTGSVLLEFVMGIGLYFVLRRHRFTLPRPALVALTLLGFGLLAVDNSDAARGFLDGPCATLIVGSTVLWAQGLQAPWLRAIGDASYSIYLFHLAAFWLAAAALQKMGVSEPRPFTVLLVLLAHLAVAIAAGLSIHRAIERPLLGLLRRPARPAVPLLR